MDVFPNKMVLIFFTALGIIIGAALIGSFAAILCREPPVGTMLKLAREIKVWAIVAAIGGTFSTIEILESGLFQGEVRAVVKQLIYIISALAGTQTGYYILMMLSGDNR
ncbi:YtrH family sporulation protein [Desulfotruncus alcoholivorax]|uniref:YtrH family sporulation protein n=1 Tax=Desulfotruncus alcoholivorax TaxID=265477 RepID=UPI0004846275|nr:YtrH family sporulation protein [Desulfotruncus alcoholivorax]